MTVRKAYAQAKKELGHKANAIFIEGELVTKEEAGCCNLECFEWGIDYEFEDFYFWL